MKMRGDAVAWNQQGEASAHARIENSQQGWVIAGASGENAAASASIEGGRGDVITYQTTLPDGRNLAMAIAIGNDPRPQDGPATTHLVGRAAYRRR